MMVPCLCPVTCAPPLALTCAPLNLALLNPGEANRLNPCPVHNPVGQTWREKYDSFDEFLNTLIRYQKIMTRADAQQMVALGLVSSHHPLPLPL
jgi:hypothetical protein